MKARVYVASSWKNELQQDVVAALRKDGFEVYDFKHPDETSKGFHWSDVMPNYKGGVAPAEFRKALDHPLCKEGFARDFNAMLNADVCVMVMPCGRSAHIEAGYFVGNIDKFLIIFIPTVGLIEPELMYKMADKIVLSMPELLSVLQETYG